MCSGCRVVKKSLSLGERSGARASQIFSRSAASIVSPWSTFPVLRVVAGSNNKMLRDPLRDDRFVLDAPRDDEELTGLERDDLVAEVDLHTALDDEKHLVFRLVMVPDVLVFGFHDLYVLPVELTDDLGDPSFAERVQFFLDVDFFHESLLRDEASAVLAIGENVCG